MDLENSAETQSVAENQLWQYLRNRLEKSGQGETAAYLNHFLLPQAGEPVVRGELALVPFEMFHRVSDYTDKLDAMSGESLGWHFEALAEEPGNTVSKEDALMAALVEANLPSGALLKVSDYEQVGGAPVFIARWEHEEGGIPVERDYIHVLVNGNTGRPFALHRKWHAVNFNPTER